MIQELGDFLKKWGNVLVVLLGCILIIVSVILQLMEVEYYEYYDLRRYESVIRVPISINYYIGAFLILISFKRKWFSSIKEKVKK